jgi:hypothetical protein
MRGGVEKNYQAFFYELFTHRDTAGTLVVQVPKFIQGMEGLKAALNEMKNTKSSACQRIILVSDDRFFTDQLDNSINV